MINNIKNKLLKINDKNMSGYRINHNLKVIKCLLNGQILLAHTYP